MKKGRIDLEPRERAVIDAMIAFANHDPIATDVEVIRLFGKVIDFRDLYQPEWSAVTVSFVDHYREVQQAVQGALMRLTDRESRQTQIDVMEEIRRALYEEDIAGALVVDPKADRLRYVDDVRSVHAACLIAIALILDERFDHANRAVRCRRNGCGKFVFDAVRRRGHFLKLCDEHRPRITAR